MRKQLAVIAGVLILIGANATIFARERLLRDGRVVLLALAPVDPRSLMQGDYMALRFALAEKLAEAPDSETDGTMVAALDAGRVATFRRIDRGEPLAPGEVRLRYRMRGDGAKFGTNAFFFQEGQGDVYARARFGEFRVADSGAMILTGLRDEQLAPLGARTAP